MKDKIVIDQKDLKVRKGQQARRSLPHIDKRKQARKGHRKHKGDFGPLSIIKRAA